MKDILAHFFREHPLDGRPLILGLSGGADSRCLFHLLCELKIPFHAAHIDHQWRPTSAIEAEELRVLANSRFIPFHMTKIEPVLSEVICREKRLSYFKHLLNEVNAQSLLLGHHANDQAETILKRMFEGAPLLQLHGMKEVSCWEGMPIWRPLLKVPKHKMVTWLKERGLPWFEDSTNEDARYLRARMRKKMIPNLAEQFGKEIAAPLARLGEESREMFDYFEAKLAPLKALKTEDLEGLHWDFSQMHLSYIEWKILLRMILEGYSYQEIERGAWALKEKESKVWLRKDEILLHRGHLHLYI